MSFFRMNSIVVEAFCWTGDIDQAEDSEWAIAAIKAGKIVFYMVGSPEVRMIITAMEGVMEATPGDYIIKGVKGEIYPCKPDIFQIIYKPVDAQHPAERIQAAIRELILACANMEAIHAAQDILACRFYKADGSYEVLESAEAVITRRKECAATLQDQAAEIATLRHDLANAQQIAITATELLHLERAHD
ncbi:MAG: hypothetical protein P4L11_13580 [Geothrix sp.]|nr:hypothetical protein [Geothrix sp.]